LFIYYTVVIAAIFSLLGIIVGLWANSFEQLGALNIFIITPLSFLGGMFNTIDMLPPLMQKIVVFNPFFYFIDGMRYTMTGLSNSNLLVGNMVLLGLLFGLAGVVWYLFKVGWRMRD
jgi:ABC-2 type transport system permease protein